MTRPEGTGGPLLESHVIEIDGRPLRYLIGGSGPPLVLLHGFLSSGEEFGGRFAALTASHAVIAPDLPGHGESAPLPGAHTAAQLAATVEALLVHLGVDECDAGGLCLGSTVACALAARQGPVRVRRLILHTPILGPQVLTPLFRRQIRLFTRNPLWTAGVWLSRRRMVSDLHRRLVVRESNNGRETADITFRNQLRTNPRAAREWLVDALRVDNTEWLAHRTEPSLVLTARADTIVDVDRIQRSVAAMPAVRLLVDEATDHGWTAAIVERQTRTLAAFLERGQHEDDGWRRERVI